MRQNKFTYLLIISLFIIAFSACRKTDKVAPQSMAAVTPVAVSPDVIKDSVLLFTKELYLWYNQIPASFNARSYDDPAKIMEAIHPYSIEPGFTQPVDKWSFAMKKTEWDNLSGGLSDAFAGLNSTGDFGLGVFFLSEGDLRVKSVEKLSPAGLAGIHRSWRVTMINGNSNLTTSNAAFIVSNVYKSTNSTFTFIKPDGSSVNISLTAASYHQRPVYMDTVYDIASKHIGYLVFNSFLGDTVEINNDLQRVFSNFNNYGVTDLVIDLRYNGGGYVSVAQKFADYLIPGSAAGGLMMREQYNDKNSRYNNSVYFTKKGSFTPQHIYFIVTTGTASASELLINNLKPYMDVKLVGPSTTHGKPVGFFPVAVGDWYIFPVSFRSFNKNGEGNYFNGMPVNSSVGDGLDKDWGNIQEACLARTIKYITTGTFLRQTNEPPYIGEPEVINGNNVLDANTFKGTIDARGIR